ncbi:Cheerio / Filamin-A/C -like protein [Dinothrombium tinctorium]|uniref:Cheerio / Filamin-A/C-like protein n=1 Tax=Dinothrombium tinctorium TaxID=1965070 RepID=A0A3S3S2Z6_9ACAR|nr:Cheerio / Filamin-A/C -like protein [Dinothrombium tinctorium]
MCSAIDINDITAVGPGLVTGETGGICHFNVYINRRKANYDVKDFLEFFMEGPSEPIPLRCADNEQDGCIDVTYSPILPGEYKIFIRCNGQNIKGSPFCPIICGESIRQNLMTSKVNVSGEGLKHGKVREENEVVVDIGDYSISGGLKVAIAGPRNAKATLKMVHIGGCKYKVTYTPTIPGVYYLHVKIANSHIPQSPFPIKVK